jgi:hypothetical protein
MQEYALKVSAHLLVEGPYGTQKKKYTETA